MSNVTLWDLSQLQHRHDRISSKFLKREAMYLIHSVPHITAFATGRMSSKRQVRLKSGDQDYIDRSGDRLKRCSNSSQNLHKLGVFVLRQASLKDTVHNSTGTRDATYFKCLNI